jgi:proteasome lid subunit RPN8/RPN11
VTLVATRDFVDPTDGMPVKKGMTYVDESADVARSYPENFAPASRKLGAITRIGGSVELVDRPTQKRSETILSREKRHGLEVPELRADGTATVKVKLCPGAVRGIEAELERSHGILGSHETGGNLFGRTRGGVLELIAATGPGEDGQARRFEGAVMVSISEGHAIAEELRRAYGDNLIGVVGGWHCHPRPVREPSEPDRENALVALDDLVERDGWKAPAAWIDLIFFPDTAEGWEAPRCAAWVTRRRDWDGAAVTEPAAIET